MLEKNICMFTLSVLLGLVHMVYEYMGCASGVNQTEVSIHKNINAEVQKLTVFFVTMTQILVGPIVPIQSWCLTGL